MKIKKNAMSIDTDDFWYDLFESGQIGELELNDVLEPESCHDVMKAIETLQWFKEELEKNDLINYF